MDSTDIYALLNAGHILLNALYIETVRNDEGALQRMTETAMVLLTRPPDHPVPDPSELAEIQSHTEDAVRAFLERLGAAPPR